jgi:hypothetical protein
VRVRFSSNVLGALRDSLLIGGLILGFLLTTHLDRPFGIRSLQSRLAAVGLAGERRLLQFLPFYFAEPGIQYLPHAHQTGPNLDADELHAGSLVRV